MHTAARPPKPRYWVGFRGVMHNWPASYGGGPMSRMESDESDTKRVTVRVPEQLLEQYDDSLDDDTSRSAALRDHMREEARQPATDGGLATPQDDDTLAAGYEALKESAGDAPLPVDEAKSLIASKVNIPKSSTSRRVLTPLHRRGYLRRCGDPINRPMLEVR